MRRKLSISAFILGFIFLPATVLADGDVDAIIDYLVESRISEQEKAEQSAKSENLQGNLLPFASVLGQVPDAAMPPSTVRARLNSSSDEGEELLSP